MKVAASPLSRNRLPLEGNIVSQNGGVAATNLPSPLGKGDRVSGG